MEKDISSVNSHILVEVLVAIEQEEHTHIFPANFQSRPGSLLVFLFGFSCNENVSFVLVEPAPYTDKTTE